MRSNLDTVSCLITCLQKVNKPTIRSQVSADSNEYFEVNLYYQQYITKYAAYPDAKWKKIEPKCSINSNWKFETTKNKQSVPKCQKTFILIPIGKNSKRNNAWQILLQLNLILSIKKKKKDFLSSSWYE